MSDYGHPHNLGGHNALLKVIYDLWARNRFFSHYQLCVDLQGYTLIMGWKPTLGLKTGI